MLFSKVNVPMELTLQAQMPHADPFNEIDVDVDITGPNGATWTVPGFWAGDDRFKVRFAGPTEGRYELRSRCSDPLDAGLHGQVAELTVRAYDGSNELYRHGRIRVTADKRRFEHVDGTPFMWLADTHWQAFTSRLDWPHGFATLADDRAAKGFSVIHMVAGPLSGFDADESWHSHQSNEAGWPWEPGWTRINPDFYEAVDLKIAGYVERGLMPCIVGMWGYYMNLMGIERIRRHWRYLVARYGALPVVWCLAGEVQMAVYSVMRAGGQAHADALAEQADGWTEMSHYVRAIDPFHNLVTAHPAAIGNVESIEGSGDGPPPTRHLSGSARSVLRDDAELDFDMLQCGHFGFQLLEPTVELVQQAIAQEPVMPLVNGEVNYEGIAGSCWQDLQRFQFWSCHARRRRGLQLRGGGTVGLLESDDLLEGRRLRVHGGRGRRPMGGRDASSRLGPGRDRQAHPGTIPVVAVRADQRAARRGSRPRVVLRRRDPGGRGPLLRPVRARAGVPPRDPRGR